MKTHRTHDKLYLSEDYKTEPKEYFKTIESLIKNDLHLGEDSEFDLIDIGCETGSFLYYIRRCYKNANLYGVDVMDALLDSLRNDMRIEAHVFLGNIDTGEGLPTTKFDVVTMLGVMSIFDDFKNAISNCVSLLKEDGYAYIFGIFNPEDIDALIKVRRSDSPKGEGWESGWNLFSIKSISTYLEGMKLRFDFIPFQIGIDIKKHGDDPLRSWTIKGRDDERLIINGIQLVHRFYILRIKR